MRSDWDITLAWRILVKVERQTNFWLKKSATSQMQWTCPAPFQLVLLFIPTAKSGVFPNPEPSLLVADYSAILFKPGQPRTIKV
jgi:hypothetical protein